MGLLSTERDGHEHHPSPAPRNVSPAIQRLTPACLPHAAPATKSSASSTPFDTRSARYASSMNMNGITAGMVAAMTSQQHARAP